MGVGYLHHPSEAAGELLELSDGLPRALERLVVGRGAIGRGRRARQPQLLGLVAEQREEHLEEVGERRLREQWLRLARAASLLDELCEVCLDPLLEQGHRRLRVPHLTLEERADLRGAQRRRGRALSAGRRVAALETVGGELSEVRASLVEFIGDDGAAAAALLQVDDRALQLDELCALRGAQPVAQREEEVEGGRARIGGRWRVGGGGALSEVCEELPQPLLALGVGSERRRAQQQLEALQHQDERRRSVARVRRGCVERRLDAIAQEHGDDALLMLRFDGLAALGIGARVVAERVHRLRETLEVGAEAPEHGGEPFEELWQLQ